VFNFIKSDLFEAKLQKDDDKILFVISGLVTLPACTVYGIMNALSASAEAVGDEFNGLQFTEIDNYEVGELGLASNYIII
jgi:hypothetical protein